MPAKMPEPEGQSSSRAPDRDPQPPPPVAPKVPSDQAPPTASADPPEISNSGARERSTKSAAGDVWNRRNVLIAGTALAATIGGTYWAMRSALVADKAEQREQDRQDWELPAMQGSAVAFKVLGEKGFGGDLMALPSDIEMPDWFGQLHESKKRQNWVLDNGGAWVDGIVFRLMITNLRRSIVIESASVRFLRRSSPLNGTVIMGTVQGGSGGEMSEIPRAGANLDSQRPALRALDTATGTLGDPFPTNQITLSPQAVQAIDVRIESKQPCTEFEILLELFVDGQEQIDVPIRPSSRPFRITGRSTSYGAGLHETGPDDKVSAGMARLEPIDPTKIVSGHG